MEVESLSAVADLDSILRNWWLMRLITAMFLGASLSLVGTALQRQLKNDLADPYLLGLSSASLLGGVFSSGWILPLLGLGAHSLLANSVHIAGAFLAGFSLFLFLIWAKGKLYHSSSGLILLGIVVNSFCGAAIMMLMSLNHPLYPKVDYGWLVGRIEPQGWPLTAAMCALVSVGMLGLIWLRKGIVMSAYGYALQRLSNVKANLHLVLLLLCVCTIVSTVSAFAGAVGFVGLIVPHLVRGLLRIISSKGKASQSFGL